MVGYINAIFTLQINQLKDQEAQQKFDLIV